MCTQDEVRQVIRETAAPGWFKWVMSVTGAILVAFILWLAASVHSQETTLANEMGQIRLDNAVANAEMMNQIEIMSLQLDNIKVLTSVVSQDLYTGKEANAQITLMDERCKNYNKRLEAVEEKVNLHREQH